MAFNDNATDPTTAGLNGFDSDPDSTTTRIRQLWHEFDDNATDSRTTTRLHGFDKHDTSSTTTPRIHANK